MRKTSIGCAHDPVYWGMGGRAPGGGGQLCWRGLNRVVVRFLRSVGACRNIRLSVRRFSKLYRRLSTRISKSRRSETSAKR